MSDFPVIGICGPAKSGKDLVADWFLNTKGFGKVAFADPMKRFVKEMFGCNTDILWGPSELREARLEYSEEQWFGIIQRGALAINKLLNEVCTQSERIRSYLSLSEWLSSMRESHKANGFLTMREILQTLGTEWGRRKVHPLLWVNYLYNKVVPELTNSKRPLIYAQERGLYGLETDDGRVSTGYCGIVIPDHRFLNEVQATQKQGGYCIRLRRMALEKEAAVSNVGIKDHQSEVEMRDIPDSAFDLVAELPEGAENVHARLEQIFEDKAWELRRKISSDTAPSTTDSSSSSV